MYWFYHEFLDEARRFRIHRVEADTEKDARNMHRLACAFNWVTHHIEPSVSPLMEKGDGGPRTIAPGHRPGTPYHTDFRWTKMPDYIRELIGKVEAKNEAAVLGLREADERREVRPAFATAQQAAKQDGLDTPF